MKKLISAVLAAALIVAVGGCAKPQAQFGEGEAFEEDEIVPISIKDDFDADKVETEGFVLPEATESKESFDLPLLVGDGMLLQANMTVKLWGKVEAEGDIAAKVIRNDGENVYYGHIEDGEFIIYIGAQDYASTSEIRLITQSGLGYTLKNVAFGELFVGAGQSNMGWTMGQCYGATTATLRYAEEINTSENADIRLFSVAPNKASQPMNEVVSSSSGGWKQANPVSVREFSAVGYFFARELNARYDVPVGVMQSCMGGTSVYTWMPQSVTGEALGAKESDLVSEYFNGMIYPIRNAVPRGILWYQGEGQSENYAHNYSLVIKGWREMYGKANVWFSTVQLPRYTDAEEYFWGREQQKKASLENKYVTYSVNLDCGLLPENVAAGDTLNPNGIHPYDKKPVGERLAHATMQAFYGAKGVWRGPVLKSAEVSGNKVILTFSNVGKGLSLYGAAGFEIGEGNKAYVAAVPEIIGKNKVSVSAEGITAPTKVRYGLVNSSANMEKLTSYEQSVSLYNTKGDDEKAYPAEQFVWKA